MQSTPSPCAVRLGLASTHFQRTWLKSTPRCVSPSLPASWRVPSRSRNRHLVDIIRVSVDYIECVCEILREREGPNV